jgi:hypothetical protein
MRLAEIGLGIGGAGSAAAAVKKGGRIERFRVHRAFLPSAAVRAGCGGCSRRAGALRVKDRGDSGQVATR